VCVLGDDATLPLSAKLNTRGGASVAQSVKHLPSAQVMILESQDQVPHRAPHSAESLLLSLTLPFSCFLSLMLSLK